MSRQELLQWRIITVLLLTAQIRNRKTFETYLEQANVRFFPFLQDNTNKYCAVGMSERERRMRWGIAACRLNRLNVMRPTRTCSVHFEGDPGRTKLDPASSIFALPQYLQRKPPKSRRAKAAQGSQRNTTQTSKNKMVFTSRKQTIR